MPHLRSGREAPPPGWPPLSELVTNKDLARDLRALKLELRFLVCVAVVLSRLLPEAVNAVSVVASSSPRHAVAYLVGRAVGGTGGVL